MATIKPIEEKAKRYDEAIEQLRTMMPNWENLSYNGKTFLQDLVHIIPELKESEDEQHRKWILEYLYDGLRKSNEQFKGQFKAAITWFEKQGEQKPTDKVKPKFKIGDWIIGRATNNEPRQISEITDYCYNSTYGGQYGFSFEDEMHLWTIQDAKDGDVLACNEEILLFKSYSVQNRISLYCWYNGQTNNFHHKEVVDTLLTTRNKICPATKEQRDQLEKVIADAGYEWDANKKELRKIEQKPAWSEEDDKIQNDLMWMIEAYRKNSFNKGHFETANRAENWLESLKDRVVPQPQQEWSEEDKQKIDRIYSILTEAADTHAFSTSCRLIGDKECIELQNFLKSLKDRYTWKPSDEQMFDLKCVADSNTDVLLGQSLLSLYIDLKKLKE